MATTAWRGSTSFLKLTVHTRTSATIPAGVAEIDVTIAAAQGRPSLWILDAQDYSSWVTGQGDPKTYFYVAPPFTSLSTTLTFPESHNCSVLVKCGRYATTIDGTATTVAENCSSVSFAVRWVVSPYSTSLLQISSTSSPSVDLDTGSAGLSVAAVAGIVVGAIVLAFAVAFAVLFSLRRRKSSASNQHAGTLYTPLSQPPPPMHPYPPPPHFEPQPMFADPNMFPPQHQHQPYYYMPPTMTNFDAATVVNSSQSEPDVQRQSNQGSGGSGGGVIMLKHESGSK
ncbi:hypothetical protein BJ742DRAFT_744257 [Cladochytrium replicatum]|nr:hypothetical protein BJ742DRAFT_744257 [Cladochytrium replicatum]